MLSDLAWQCQLSCTLLLLLLLLLLQAHWSHACGARLAMSPDHPSVAASQSSLNPCWAGTYLVPTVHDIAADLRVSLLPEQPDTSYSRSLGLVHSSRNVGEAPLFLGASAFFALKQVCALACSEASTSARPAVFAAQCRASREQVSQPAMSQAIRCSCLCWAHGRVLQAVILQL